MKIPKLKISTKDLTLGTLGVCAVMAINILGQPIFAFILIGMFFGLLSPSVRWMYWGTNVLVCALSCINFILRTDYIRMISSTLGRVLDSTRNTSPIEYIIINNTLTTNSTNVFVRIAVQATSNPTLNNPIIFKILISIFTILGVIAAAASIVLGICYVIALSPTIGYTILMLNIFHSNELPAIISSFTENGYLSGYAFELIVPYLVQGIAMEAVLAVAVLPLICYKILKRIGFYTRIQNITSQ